MTVREMVVSELEIRLGTHNSLVEQLKAPYATNTLAEVINVLCEVIEDVKKEVQNVNR